MEERSVYNFLKFSELIIVTFRRNLMSNHVKFCIAGISAFASSCTKVHPSSNLVNKKIPLTSVNLGLQALPCTKDKDSTQI